METIKIGGMSCRHCVAAVTEALEKIEGVTEVNVDLSAGQASFKNNGVEREKIKMAISQIGFDPGD